MRLLKSNYTLGEAAKILRVSKRAVGYFLKKGILIRGKILRPCVSRMGIARVLELATLMQNFQLLRAKEVAKQLGVCANSVYRYCEEGRLLCVKLGKTSIFFQKDVEDFLRLRKQGLKQKKKDNL